MLSFLTASIASSQEDIESIITKNNFAFWDTESGYDCWYFNKNGIAVEYMNKKNKRYIPDMGDVIGDHYYWKINKDTVFLCVDSTLKRGCNEYKILAITDNYMKVEEKHFIHYANKPAKVYFIIREYTLSKDQTTLPEYEDDDCPLRWREFQKAITQDPLEYVQIIINETGHRMFKYAVINYKNELLADAALKLNAAIKEGYPMDKVKAMMEKINNSPLAEFGTLKYNEQMNEIVSLHLFKDIIPRCNNKGASKN